MKSLHIVVVVGVAVAHGFVGLIFIDLQQLNRFFQNLKFKDDVREQLLGRLSI